MMCRRWRGWLRGYLFNNVLCMLCIVRIQTLLLKIPEFKWRAENTSRSETLTCDAMQPRQTRANDNVFPHPHHSHRFAISQPARLEHVFGSPRLPDISSHQASGIAMHVGQPCASGVLVVVSASTRNDRHTLFGHSQLHGSHACRAALALKPCEALYTLALRRSVLGSCWTPDTARGEMRIV
ncbi:hypothetical protein C7974DRAFT_176809 [Boeremia exigua]|uniref:uncharacterized protein n=1 Tax=Boeremia exigua TaxID=749465 RepID=UPI001E8DC175|nr:uncharacterized protein C7974DRAFT_176809 [Boeremia exigua]KAH6633685.1 hypothetical protein C7974DRAFT_176809 [Boeremia exigua]